MSIGGLHCKIGNAVVVLSMWEVGREEKSGWKQGRHFVASLSVM
jgi:hypothetical protein